MENNESPDDGHEQSSAKIVIGVRGMPILKEELIYESSEVGLSVSEYAETILLNRHQESPEMERLAKKVTEKQQEVDRLTKLAAEQLQEIEKLKAQVAATGNKQSELAKTENEELRNKIEELNNQLTIYSDQRLLYLFQHLKGKKDKVENAYSGGNFDIVYDSPKAVLTALIYSSKLNK